MNESVLEHEIIAAVRSDALRVPPYPRVYARLQAALVAPHSTMSDIADIVVADAAVSALVLRVAASPIYRRARAPRTVQEACGRLGVHAIASLAMAHAVGKTIGVAGPLMDLRRLFWRQSVLAAEVSRSLAELRKLAPDEAYMLALLHDFGRVVTIGCVEEVLRKHPDAVALPADTWRTKIETYNAELGLVVAAKWDLPSRLTDVIGGYHYGGLSEDTTAQYVKLLRTADGIVALLETKVAITPADLDAIQDITAPERQKMARFLPKLPATIDAYELPAAAMPSSRPASLVEQPETTLVGMTKAVEWPTRRVRPVTESVFRVVSMASNGLQLVGPQTLPVNSVIELEIDCGEPKLRLWFVVGACWQRTGGFVMEGKPMALGGLAKQRWDDLWRRLAAHPRTIAVPH